MAQKYEMIQTKVSKEAHHRLKQIEHKKGLTSYGIIQMMCDCIVRYMDDQHNLTPELEQAMSIFEHMEGWKDALNWADPSVNKEVVEAIYFLVDPEGKKKGTRAVLVTKPFFGNWTEDKNIQHIVERVLELLLPERYRRMRAMARDAGCDSLLSLLDTMIDHHTQGQDMDEIRADFEDAERSDFGKKPTGPYQRRHNKTLDAFEQAELKKQREQESADWLNENMDYKPNGYEW